MSGNSPSDLQRQQERWAKARKQEKNPMRVIAVIIAVIVAAFVAYGLRYGV